IAGRPGPHTKWSATGTRKRFHQRDIALRSANVPREDHVPLLLPAGGSGSSGFSPFRDGDADTAGAPPATGPRGLRAGSAAGAPPSDTPCDPLSDDPGPRSAAAASSLR